MSKNKRAAPADKRPTERLSLAGMDPEDALRKALSTSPPTVLEKKTTRKSRGKSRKK